MTEENKAEFRTEGERAFPTDKENENSSSSPEGEENNGDQNDSSNANSNGDGNKKDTDDAGFLDHPRWKEREEDWKKRFNEQETRHTSEIQKIREEFGEKRQDNKEQTKIPSWFGGTQDQWDAYRADRDADIKAAEERAIERIKGEKSTEEKAVKEATEYMQSEISAIESDKELNPEGLKVDPNKLLKFVLDNDLVDSKGRWNYKAGFKLMKQSGGATTQNNDDRKKIAGATTSESKAESKPVAFKTGADFKGGNRPW